MMRILVTRPLRQALKTQLALEALGHQAVIDPMLAIERIKTCLPPGPFDAVIVTSQNALDALAPADRKALLDRPLVAVGPETAATAERLGFTKVHAAAGTVESLARAVLQAFSTPLRFLYLAGIDRSRDLSALFASHGHSLATHAVYEAKMSERLLSPTTQALEEGRIDAVLHYSERAARAFLACAQKTFGSKRNDVIIIPSHLCLSDRTAGPLREVKMVNVVVAATPDQGALFALLGPSRKTLMS